MKYRESKIKYFKLWGLTSFNLYFRTLKLYLKFIFNSLITKKVTLTVYKI